MKSETLAENILREALADPAGYGIRSEAVECVLLDANAEDINRTSLLRNASSWQIEGHVARNNKRIEFDAMDTPVTAYAVELRVGGTVLYRAHLVEARTIQAGDFFFVPVRALTVEER